VAFDEATEVKPVVVAMAEASIAAVGSGTFATLASVNAMWAILERGALAALRLAPLSTEEYIGTAMAVMAAIITKETMSSSKVNPRLARSLLCI
jgi:hypothetical protein